MTIDAKPIFIHLSLRAQEVSSELPILASHAKCTICSSKGLSDFEAKFGCRFSSELLSFFDPKRVAKSKQSLVVLSSSSSSDVKNRKS